MALPHTNCNKSVILPNHSSDPDNRWRCHAYWSKSVSVILPDHSSVIQTKDGAATHIGASLLVFYFQTTAL